MLSALPFAGAADTQNIQNNGVNQSLNQNNVGTNAVTDNGLQLGASGDQVVELQKWLKNQGYYTGAIDGSFGPYTEQAVKCFQTDANITVDGWVATQTENAMKTLTGANPITGTTSNNNTTNQKTVTTKTTATSQAATTKAATQTTAVTAAKAKVTSTTTSTQKTISGWFEPTGAFDSGYAYQWYYVTWLNYDPSSGQWGVLEYNPKGADGGELTSSVTGVDFDGVSGYEKEYSPRWQLTKA